MLLHAYKCSIISIHFHEFAAVYYVYAMQGRATTPQQLFLKMVMDKFCVFPIPTIGQYL